MTVMKRLLSIIICMMFLLASCGGGTDSSAAAGVAGDWELGGIYYNGRLIDINDVPGLDGNEHLTINEDGSFVYLRSVFGNKGKVVKLEADGNLLLDSEETFIYEYENGEIVQTPTTEKNNPTKFLAEVLDENTIRVSEYDAAFGKISADADPKLFVLSGKESEFIESNKFAINKGGGSGSTQTETPDSQTGSSKSGNDVSAGTGSYQSILDEYTAKMEDAVPGLVSEYESEASGVSDISRRAEICNDKVGELAEICNEGVSEMASLMQKNGDSYDTYEKWAGKLMDNYSELASEIQDAYLNSSL